MDIGALRHRVSVQEAREPVIRDEHGGIQEEWITWATRWASVEPLQGRELFQAQQVDARVTHRVRLRYLEGLKPVHRLLHRSRVLHILAVLNPQERNEQLEVLAMEAV